MKKPHKTAGELATRIPFEELPKFIGRRIHLAWANPACQWVLDEIRGNTLVCRTPTTNKILSAKAEDACYTLRYDVQRREREELARLRRKEAQHA